MRKKILDAALLFAFALCLIVTSNIQEEAAYVAELENEAVPLQNQEAEPEDCLLYTSDAADEEDSVDLGGRRICKKKKNRKRD